MNKLKSSGIILFTIIAICYLGFTNVKNISKISENYLEQIQKATSEDNYAETKNIFENFKFFWRKKSKLLGIITHHENLDNIEYEITKLSSAINQKDSQDIERYCECAKSKFKNLREAHEITLENIL